MDDIDLSHLGAKRVEGNNIDLSHLGAKRVGDKEESRPESISRESAEDIKSYLAPQLTKEQRLNTLKGLAQGAENVGIGYLNMLPKVNISKATWAGETPEAKRGELVADIGSFFGPGALLKGAQKGATFLPALDKVLNSAFESIRARPALNAIAQVGKGAGENALASAALADKEKQGQAAKTGAEIGGGASLAAQLLNSKNPIVNALMRAAAGGGAGYIGGELGGQNPIKTAGYGAGAAVAAPGLMKMLGMGGKAPGMETLEHLTPAEVQPAVNAANRLNTPITPAEASGNPFVGGIEGRYARTGEGAALHNKIGQERVVKQNAAIDDLLNTIYDTSTPSAKAASKQKIKNLYDQAYKWNMDATEMQQLRQDPVIQAGFESVRKDPAYQRKLQGIPEHNYAYLNQVRRAISDMEKKAINAGENEKAREFTQARKELVKVMDQKVPVYAQARAEAQKKITRRNIEEAMETKEIKGSTFYNTILKNETKFNELLNKLKNVPEAQDQLRDMRLAWKNLINIQKPSSAAFKSETATNESRNWASKLVDMYNEMTGAKRNVAALKFIHSPDWDKGFEKIAEIKDAEKRQQAVINLMTKALAANESRKAVVKE